MASVLDNALVAISQAWAALTPPASTPARAYERATTLDMLEGVSGHRMFWFELPSGGEAAAFARDHSTIDHDIRARVRLSTVGVGLLELPSWVAAHAVQLLNRANRIAAPGTGIRSIRASRYDLALLADPDPETGEPVPNGDLDIIVSLRIRAEEADG